MKIYVNLNNEIKAIDTTSDITLTEIEIDRELVFGSMSDFMILHYKFIKDATGYSICPAIDYDKLLYLENKEIIREQAHKISILEAENKALNTKVDTVKFTHSDLILDMDFRIMDIEDSIGIVPTTKLFMRIGENNMNSTFMLVLDKIEMGNYSDKNEIEGICDRYLARNRINSEEYDTLMKALDKKELEKN